MARCRVGPGSRLRRAAAAGRVGGDRLRRPRPAGSARVPRPAGARDRRAPGGGRARPAGDRRPGPARRRRPRQAHRRDARQSAGAAGAHTGVGPRAAAGRVRSSCRLRSCRSGSSRASCSGSRGCPRRLARLLLVAAAEPVGDPLLLWRAAERLGIGRIAASDETQGLLAIGERVAFLHPLVRSAVYRSASPHERRAVHLSAGGSDRSPGRIRPPCVASRRGSARPRRGGRLGAGAIGGPGAVARRARRGGRVPAALGRLDAGSRATDGTRARRRSGQPARRRFRCRARGARRGGGGRARRAPRRPGGSPARGDRARLRVGRRGRAAPAQGRQAARAARPPAGARDLPERLRCGDVRGTGGRRRSAAGRPRRDGAPATQREIRAR